MAEEKKEFPWIQLIATLGTIAAALIGITPYLLKLNATPAPQTPTIVIITLPPAVTTPVPATTQPVTSAETTPVVTQTTVVTTVPTTGPPLTGNETATPTPTANVTTAIPTPTPTTVPATTVTTLPPGPAIQISVNTTSVPQGGFILASGSTDPAVPQVTITLKNSTTFQSAAVPVTLTQGAFQFQVDTIAYAPGDYTIFAAVPDTQAVAQASFVITAA
jgi:hypothetical protein